MKINNLYKFFDYFGILVFTFLIVDSLFYIYAGNIDWRVISRFVVGVGELMVDIYLVFFYKE